MSPPKVGRPRDVDVDARIVEATRALLREGGLDAVTFTAVAERAGVGRPALYRRAADRDALVVDVFFDDLQQVFESAMADVSWDLPIDEQLVQLATPFLAYYAERPRLSAALLQLSMFSPSERRQRLDGQAWAYLAHIASRVEAAKQRGELLPGYDAQVFGFSFFAMYLTTAIGGVQGLLPQLETQVTTVRAMIRQHLDGGWGPARNSSG